MSAQGLSQSDIRIDAIVSSLKELQLEKNHLEQRMNDLRRKRSVIEKNVDILSGRFSQARQSTLRLKDTLKIAQQKVARTQKVVESLQKSCADANASKQNLLKEVEEFRDMQIDCVRSFEKEVLDLISKFKTAQRFHKEDNLERNISESKEKTNHLRESAQQASSDKENLIEAFQKMKLEALNRAEKEALLEIVPDIQKVVLESLHTESDLAAKAAEKALETKSKIQDENGELERKIAELEKNAGTSG